MRALLPFALTAAACGPPGPAAPAKGARPDEPVGARFSRASIPTLLDPEQVPDGAPATLVRFWTDGCPHCEASLPALDGLRERHGGRGLVVLGIYHPKPPHGDGSVPLDAELVRAWARERGFGGALALDPAWKALRTNWLDGGPRRATSASLLVDAKGVVRHVHPGPELHPLRDGDGDDHEACAEAFGALERAVDELLVEAGR